MITLRAVTFEDKEMLFKWRNDPKVYQFLFHPEPVSMEAHIQWLEKILVNPKVFFLLGLKEGAPCGTVRFDFSENFQEAEVGIYLAPEFMGQGLSGDLLAQAEKTVIQKEPRLIKLTARVLAENKNSHRLFEGLDYQVSYQGYAKKVGANEK